MKRLFSKEIRRLEDELDRLESWFEQQHDEYKALQAIKRQQDETIRLNEKRITNLQNANESLHKEIKELKGLTREQTEADILLNALKSVGIIKDEKKVNYHDLDQELRNRLASIQQYPSNTLQAALSGGGSPSLLGGLGLRGVFG